MARETGFARRFIAGETIDEAVAAVRGLSSRGLLLTLDYLGESVATSEAAAEATRDYLRIIDVIVQADIERNVSLKLTQLGLDVDRATCIDNLRRILEPAGQHGFFVRIDMESALYTEDTIQIFETLWQQGYRNVGVVLQSYLHRTAADFERVNALGARIRLVKGAYKEPREVAFQNKEEVDDNFVEVMKRLLDSGTYPAIATHDVRIIEEAKRHVAARGYGKDRFEFQMLYGIRRDLQAALLKQDYRVRLYVPFGREWYPYFMRRLGERPANVWFVVKGVLSDRS
ncbi:MAG: proline dehydrogenase family protein [Vicinamibacterales bacterium]